MTRRSILEYAEAIRPRYRKASKKGKTRILNEFALATGLHRKAAIRLLNRRGNPQKRTKRGRPKRHGLEVMPALQTLWEATDRLCSKRFPAICAGVDGCAKEERGTNGDSGGRGQALQHERIQH